MSAYRRVRFQCQVAGCSLKMTLGPYFSVGCLTIEQRHRSLAGPSNLSRLLLRLLFSPRVGTAGPAVRKKAKDTMSRLLHAFAG